MTYSSDHEVSWLMESEKPVVLMPSHFLGLQIIIL